ncbi:extracellular calcium-sensing receptor-like [Lissotriton helveticus]
MGTRSIRKETVTPIKNLEKEDDVAVGPSTVKLDDEQLNQLASFIDLKIKGIIKPLVAKLDRMSAEISYGSMVPTLSDKLQFPSFLRTVPSNTFQMMALAQLMRFFGWTWIGMIVSDDDLGMLGGQSLKGLIEKNGGCVAFMEKVHLSYSMAKITKVVEIAKRHTVKVIIVHCPEPHLKKVMEVFFALNVTDKFFVFSASFTFSHALFPRHTWPLLNGSLQLILHFSKMPGFEWFLSHLNPLQDSNDEFIKLFWEKAFNCKWPGSNTTEEMMAMNNYGVQVSCSENQTLDKMASFLFELNDLVVSFRTYLAVYALAHAMNSLISCKPGQGPFINSGCADINNFQPWQVLHCVKNINVTLDIGEYINFDVNGDPVSAFDIANVQVFDDDDIRLINVGGFDSQQGEEVHVNTKNILWANSKQGGGIAVHYGPQQHLELRHPVQWIKHLAQLDVETCPNILKIFGGCQRQMMVEDKKKQSLDETVVQIRDYRNYLEMKMRHQEGLHLCEEPWRGSEAKQEHPELPIFASNTETKEFLMSNAHRDISHALSAVRSAFLGTEELALKDNLSAALTVSTVHRGKSLSLVSFEACRDECMRCPDDKWSNEKHDHCVLKVTEFLSFEEPLGLTLTIFAAFLTFITSLVLGVFIKYRDTPIVKANNRGLSYLLLASLMLCFLCSIIFVSRPHKLTCMLRQTVFGVIFSVSVASVLAKTIVVVIVFKATNPSSSARKWLGSKTPTCIVSISILMQVVICVVWLVKSPPFAELNMVSYKEKIIVECNEGDTIFFYCMLGYMGLLATVSFIVAFLSRNLPGTFNEAKLITFSMLLFVSVWISFIPAYLSTRGKYMVAVEVFAIMCSGAGLLGCIFFPKCYIILRRPEINTRRNLIAIPHGPTTLQRLFPLMRFLPPSCPDLPPQYYLMVAAAQ